MLARVHARDHGREIEFIGVYLVDPGHYATWIMMPQFLDAGRLPEDPNELHGKFLNLHTCKPVYAKKRLHGLCRRSENKDEIRIFLRNFQTSRELCMPCRSLRKHRHRWPTQMS